MRCNGIAKVFAIVVAGGALVGTLLFPSRVLTARTVAPRGSGVAKLSILPSYAQAPAGDLRDYGWERLKEVLSEDPGNPASKTWEEWSTKCFVAKGLAVKPGGDQQMNLSPQCSTLPRKEAGGNGKGLSSQERHFLAAAQMTPQDVTKDHLGSVLFNATAAQFILDQRLDLTASGGAGVIHAVPGPPQSLNPAFPTNSVVIKAVWEVVSNEGDSTPHWPLRVYDPQNIQWRYVGGQNTGGLNPIEGDSVNSGWTTSLSLNTNETIGCPFSAGHAAKDLEEGGPTVPINCFIHRAVSDATLGISNLAVQGHSHGPRYYLVLVGLHVAKKENDGWKWTTFWLTNRPSMDKAHFEGQQQNVPHVPAQYAYFAMATSNATDGALYNPYQEGPEGPSSTVSNCAYCHSRAAVRVGIDTDFSNGMPNSGPPPQGSLYWTDHIWSLATARNTHSHVGFLQTRQLMMTNLRSRSH